MDERKLNINAPLLSVRRASATSPSLTEVKRKILEKRHTLPYYKSDLTKDQVTEPVAVPFNWEHIPGRRKGNGGSETQPPKQATITPSPRLPPGKSTNANKQPLEKECKIAKNKFRSSNKSNSFNGSVVRLDSEKERKDEKRISNAGAVVVDDDDGDVYSDALDTLSHTESFSMNCSVSGVSGLENLDTKKSGTFSTDPQTRDFMMSRFLPAAKAMTLQTPQYASRKQSSVAEQPREVNKLAREENRPFLYKPISDIIPYSEQCQEEEESEDEGEDNHDSANISAKGCGLLPGLRIRNSLCLLNPVPGVKMTTRVPVSSANEVGKPSKGSRNRSYSPAPAVKKAWDAIYKKKSSSVAASPDMQEVRKKWISESNRFTHSGELQQPSRLSPFCRSRTAVGISPCRSKPQSPLRGARLLGESKEAENNQACKLKFKSRDQGNIQGVQSQGPKNYSNSGSLTVEKTLYIDTASTVKLSCSNRSSVDNTGRIVTVVEHLDKGGRKENNSMIESSQNMKHLEALEGKGRLDSEVLGSMAANSSTLSGLFHLKSREDKAEGLATNQESDQQPVSSQLVLGTTDKDSNINNKQIVIADDSGNGNAGFDLSPLPPPLPKSPSESWLWRALPLVSVRNSFQHSNHGIHSHPKRQDSNTTSSNTKWETIVKTSNLHHNHVHNSQELPTHK